MNESSQLILSLYKKDMSNQIRMEQVFLRFPHLSEAICGQLNNESLAKWQIVSRPWNMYLNEQKLFEVRFIEAAIAKCHKTIAGSWKELFKTVSKETLVKLKHVVQKWYVNVTDYEESISPLHFLAVVGDEILFKTIYNITQDKNPKDEVGRTPLHYAAGNGKLGIFKFVSTRTNDKNPEDHLGETPLHIAASKGNLDICDYITRRVKDKNPPDENGWTPLHIAALEGHIEVRKLVVEPDVSASSSYLHK